MNRKLKEQLELVIIQCSSLKAKLDEALTRNKQYESEIEALRRKLEQLPLADREVLAQEPESPMPSEATQETETETKLETQITAEEEVKTETEPTPNTFADTVESANLSASEQKESEPLKDDAPSAPSLSEENNFQNILETGADIVSQAVKISKEYISRLETNYPDNCNNLTEIIRSRTDLFKVEISSIIGGGGTAIEKREKMNSALVNLIQYFENVK